MIKLEKPAITPAILVTHQLEWTTQLLKEISRYGTYKNIPKDIKEKLLPNYRHTEIKDALFRSSNNKCAFCESKPGESGNIEVEHFFPKSIYPEKTFEWENLLPSCRKCNEAKGTHNTGTDPILNPYTTNPSDSLFYDFIEIKAVRESPQYLVAERTIEVCDLNATRLVGARADILMNITGYVNQLKVTIQDIEAADTARKRRNKIINLRNSLELAQRLTLPKEKYSGFCKFYLQKQEAYHTALHLVSELGDSEDDLSGVNTN